MCYECGVEFVSVIGLAYCQSHQCHHSTKYSKYVAKGHSTHALGSCTVAMCILNHEIHHRGTYADNPAEYM